MQGVFQDTANAIKNILKYQNYGPNFSGDNFKIYPKDFASRLYTTKVVANSNGGSGAPNNLTTSSSRATSDSVSGNEAIFLVHGTWSQRLAVPYTANLMINTVQSYGRDITDWIKTNGNLWTPIFINMSSTTASVKNFGATAASSNFPVEIVFVFVRFASDELRWYVGNESVYLSHKENSSAGYPVMYGSSGGQNSKWEIKHEYGAGSNLETKVTLTIPQIAAFPTETEETNYGMWSDGGSIGNIWYIPGFAT